MNYFAVGNSSRCFSFIRTWVEKKIRRLLAKARQRRGFGWKRWSSRWLYERAWALQMSTRSGVASDESVSSMIGPITLGTK